jgi:steroid delta-isomerase-like uncharacterized protein
MPSSEESPHKATLRRFVDATNSGDPERLVETIDEVFAPDVRISTPLPVAATGAVAIKEVFTTLLRAYPDLHIAVDDLIEEGDKVVALQTVTGTHRGEYMGLPPTGRSVAYHEVFVFRYAGDRIAETWGVVDVLTQLQQLGAVAAPTVESQA